MITVSIIPATGLVRQTKVTVSSYLRIFNDTLEASGTIYPFASA